MRLFILLILCLWTGPAFAYSYSATYDVYAGGIHALQARLSYSEDKGRYTIGLSSETYGLLSRIVPWHAEFQTEGWVLKDLLQPQKHISDTTTRKKHEINTYTYGKDGKFLTFRQDVNGKDKTRKELDPSIMAGTTDMLSANFNLMKKLAAGKGCTFEDMIFDSERSYRLIFADHGKDEILPNKYSSFKGEALGCKAEVKPEGGKWHKKPRGWLKIQDQAKKQGQLPTIWYAPMLSAKSAPELPVKVLIKTSYGTFIAHLTSFEEKP